MILHDGLTEVCDRKVIDLLGLSEEQFYSLPYKYQRALIWCYVESVCKPDRVIPELLKSQNAAVKKKILSIFNKNK